MKLDIIQCRSAKKSPARKGQRRSIRIAISSSFHLEQKSIENLSSSLQGLPLLTLSTASSPCKVRKSRICKRKVTREPSRLEVEASKPGELVCQTHVGSNDTKLLTQDSCVSEDSLFTDHLARGKCFDHDKLPLTKQRSLERDNLVLTSQRSFNLSNSSETVLSRQTSLKIEALIEPRVLSRTNSCTTIGRKRVIGVDDFPQDLELVIDDNSLSSSSGHEFSPRKKFASPRTSSTCLDRSPSASLTVSELESLWKESFSTPSTPTSNSSFGLASSYEWPTGSSSLEELPFDLLLRIVCCLEHDDLSAALVCKRFSSAVSIAKDYHFCYTTPHRAKEGKSAQIYLSSDEEMASQGGLAETFIRPPTPNAPKHCSKRPADITSYADCPFGSGRAQMESPFAEHSIKTLRMGMVSHRVLFDEDELCKAVAENSL